MDGINQVQQQCLLDSEEQQSIASFRNDIDTTVDALKYTQQTIEITGEVVNLWGDLLKLLPPVEKNEAYYKILREVEEEEEKYARENQPWYENHAMQLHDFLSKYKMNKRLWKLQQKEKLL